MAQPFYIPLVMLAAVVGVVVGFVAWLRGDRAGARPLTLFVFAASFWAVAEGVGLASAGLGSIRFWKQVGFTLSAVIPVAWLVTVLEYTGADEWFGWRTLAVLLVEPAAYIVLIWTNLSHGLVWTNGHRELVGSYSTLGMDFGLAFWGHQVYSYLLVAVGGLLLLRVIFRSNTLYRRQSTALLAAVVFPLVGNALYAFGLISGGIDPTALMYVLSGIVLAVAMFRSQLLHIAPAIRDLGREELLSELTDPVLIIDRDDRLVDMNPAGRRLVDGGAEEPLGNKLDWCCPDLAAALEAETTQLRFDSNGSVRYFDVRVSSLSRTHGSVSGRLISLRDVTEQRQREQRLDVLNRILRHNIRNELNVARGNVDMARLESEDEELTTRLDSAIETIDGVVDRSDKVNTLSRLFDTDTGGTLDLSAHLRSDLSTLRMEFPEATVELDLPETLDVGAGPSLVAAFDELVRNAVEHGGEGPEVLVTVAESTTNAVTVEVRDDGPGIEEQELHALRAGRETALDHGSGVGLWLANWVVERNGGTLSFTNTDAGCTARVRLPRPGASPDHSDTVKDAATGTDRLFAVGESSRVARDEATTDEP